MPQESTKQSIETTGRRHRKARTVKATTPEGWTAITKAVGRFLDLRTAHGMTNSVPDRMNLEIALDMVNRRTPLDLVRLANDFDDFNLSHDIGGIIRFVNPNGSLRDHFVPRCSLPEAR